MNIVTSTGISARIEPGVIPINLLHSNNKHIIPISQIETESLSSLSDYPEITYCLLVASNLLYCLF